MSDIYIIEIIVHQIEQSNQSSDIGNHTQSGKTNKLKISPELKKNYIMWKNILNKPIYLLLLLY